MLADVTWFLVLGHQQDLREWNIQDATNSIETKAEINSRCKRSGKKENQKLRMPKPTPITKRQQSKRSKSEEQRSQREGRQKRKKEGKREEERKTRTGFGGSRSYANLAEGPRHFSRASIVRGPLPDSGPSPSSVSTLYLHGLQAFFQSFIQSWLILCDFIHYSLAYHIIEYLLPYSA